MILRLLMPMIALGALAVAAQAEAPQPAAPAATRTEAPQPAAPVAAQAEAPQPVAPAATRTEAPQPAAPAATRTEAPQPVAPAATRVEAPQPVAPAAAPVEAPQPAAPPVATRAEAPQPVAPAAATPAEAPQPAAPAAAKSTWDTYRVLSERNIFVRNRTVPRTYSSAPSPPPVTAPRESLVLTGVLQQGDSWLAFFEDTRTGATTRARVGRPLAQGTLLAVTLNGIEYQRGSTTVKVAIGEDLAGIPATLRSISAPRPTTPATAPAAAPATASASPAPGPPGTGGPPTPPGTTAPQAPPPAEVRPAGGPTSVPEDAAAEILRRMRERREQELRQ